jgi:hypothetical protein
MRTWRRAEVAESERDGALAAAGEGKSCPCGEPRDVNGDCPGSWHECDWHGEGDEPEEEL